LIFVIFFKTITDFLFEILDLYEKPIVQKNPDARNSKSGNRAYTYFPPEQAAAMTFSVKDKSAIRAMRYFGKLSMTKWVREPMVLSFRASRGISLKG
jgi:hypothetical protein